MATSRVEPFGFQRGRASITAQVIPATSTFDWDIPLDRDDYSVGTAVFGVPNSVSLRQNRRNTAALYFTNTEADAVAQTNEFTTITIPGYPSGSPYTVQGWPFQFYAFDLDTVLSPTRYGDASSNVRIKSAHIVGAVLRITMQNLVTVGRTFTAEVEFRVWRTP